MARIADGKRVATKFKIGIFGRLLLWAKKTVNKLEKFLAFKIKLEEKTLNKIFVICFDLKR